MGRQGSLFSGSLKWLSGIYESKENPVDPLDVEKFAGTGYFFLLYVFNIGLTTSPFRAEVLPSILKYFYNILIA